VLRRIALGLAALAFVSGVLLLPVHAQGATFPGAVVHIVQRGETLLTITRRYGLTVDAITHANGISDPRHIYVGQRLVIPGGGRRVGEMETAPYIVSAGDTLVSIAGRYDTTWQTLVEINGLLSPNVSYAGQVIQVPADGEGALPGGRGTPYVVRPGDTALRIALRHDVSTWAIAAASHVPNLALIYPGQELTLPGDGLGLLPEPFLYVGVQPLPAVQGDVMVIEVRTTEPVTLRGWFLEREVRFAEEGGVYYGLVGVHVFTEPGLYELTLAAEDDQGYSTTVTTGVLVEAGSFRYERIRVGSSRSSLLDPAVIATERERLDAVVQTFTPERRWTGPFQRPCVGTISSYFGTHRSYNSRPYTAYHTGVDLRAPSGTIVRAAAAGTVVLAEPMAIHGNLIILDHGWGVLTGYAHLSSMDVEVGQQVAAGDPIGRVGNTGLSTGAHLHWEVWVGGISVNGLQWLEEFYPWPERVPAAAGG